jgi:CheY-like chemotaxis protein
MTDQTFRVFVVDDDAATRMMVAYQLQGTGLDVREFGGGQACLDACGDAPDIVLLDVEMPGMDGIAVCRALREAGHVEAQIVFVSSHDDLDTRLKAYDAGGNDYIVKPFHTEELLRKVEVAKGAIQARRAASGQAQYAQSAAFTAMTSMGEMGVVLEFLRASFACRDADELGAALCRALEQYGLQGMAELRDDGHGHCYSSRGRCTALETAILGHARGMERIFQFRDRMAINYPHATLLIPNLPLDDPDRIGRLRDHLAVLAEGAEARFVAMLGENRRLAQAQSILGAVNELTRTLDEIEQHQARHRAQVLQIAHEQLENLTRAFVHLGLTEVQEESLVTMTQEGIDRIAGLQDVGLAIGQRLREVTARLKGMTEGASP